VTCTEAIYSEQVLDYIVSSYIREETLVERYQPTCYSRIGGGGTIVYREENRIDSQTINQFGYGTVPHVYGLMGYEALEAAGVMQIRRQPYLDFYGQGVIVGFVDTLILRMRHSVMPMERRAFIRSGIRRSARAARPSLIMAVCFRSRRSMRR